MLLFVEVLVLWRQDVRHNHAGSVAQGALCRPFLSGLRPHRGAHCGRVRGRQRIHDLSAAGRCVAGALFDLILPFLQHRKSADFVQGGRHVLVSHIITELPSAAGHVDGRDAAQAAKLHAVLRCRLHCGSSSLLPAAYFPSG